jgi:adenine-specific DNA-methyltransferase
MTIEYLGNKSQLLDFVVGPILAEPGVETVADVFCGTASVSRALAESGRRVIANDQLQLCATLAEAELLAQTAPVFEGVRHAAAARPGEPVYAAVMRTLNDLAPVGGFFHRTYSPASGKEGATRMYLTEENAGKVDAIREQLGTWEPLLTRAERAILLRDLVRAVARVSTTAGTYG